jgi:hypothetical protein
MRKIARHAVTVYLYFPWRRALGVGISVPETPIPQQGLLLANKLANGARRPVITFRTHLLAVGKILFRSARASGAGAFEHDLDATVLGAAVRRVVRVNRMRFAEPLGRDDVRVDALRSEIRDDIVGPA